jgi:hypothetical protein
MNKSDAINELAAALSKAQGEFTNPTPDATVTVRSEKGSYNFKYATLGKVLDTIRPVMAKHGLAITVSCFVDQVDHSVEAVQAILLHSSGQWLASTLRIPATQKAQEQGSQLSYKQRYLVRLLLNLATDEDDDANVADGNAVEKQGYKPKYQKTGAPDPIGPVGEIPDHSAAAPAANAEPAAGRPSVAVGFLNSLAASSTEQQIDGLTKQIALVSKSITEPEKVKLREAVAAARLRVAATPAKLVDVPNLLRELTGLRQQLGDGMFNAMLQKAGGEERAGYGLSAEKLVALREECVKAIG